jgi:Rieske 2Fe-2S family protein
MVSQGVGVTFAPAPLDRAELEAALRPFGESRMLPRNAYVDPDVFAWEQRHFFGGGWLCVARSDQLPEPGDQRAEATGPGGVLLVRGEGAQGQAIICPYHAWTYSLEGELRAAAGFRRQPGFDFGQWGLPQLPVTEWHGLVFVDSSGGQSGSLTDALAKLDELVAPYEPERLVTAGRHSYDSAANWKILTENYHECYHCPSIHPELCRVSPPKSGENYAADGAWIGGWMDLREGMATMSLDGSSGGVPLRTGRRASRCSAGCPRRTPRPGRCHPPRTRCTPTSRPSPGATSASRSGAASGSEAGSVGA